jgi:hypothetical protein
MTVFEVSSILAKEFSVEQRTEEKQPRFQIDRLEERIAPTATGNPGNNNPGENNTNLTGNQPKDGGSGNNPR